jgi:cellobiose-specific phosphotransferase system component IIC
VGGLFLAYFLESITLMASMQDQEFGQWIEEKRGALTITLRTFTYTLALTAITMMFSIGSLVAVAFHQTTIIPPWVGIPSFFLFSYSVLAAVAQASNTYDYVRTRIMYLHRKSQGES